MRGQIIAAGGEVRFNTQLTGLRFEARRARRGRGARRAHRPRRAHPRAARRAGVRALGARHVRARARGGPGAGTEAVLGGRAHRAPPARRGPRRSTARPPPIRRSARPITSSRSTCRRKAAKGAAPAGAPRGAACTRSACARAGRWCAAASEAGGVVVNGMSALRARRRERERGAAGGRGSRGLPGSDDPLAGVELQRRMERAAYEAAVAAGGAPYAAPAQTVGDFLAGRAGGPSAAVRPTYARGVAWCDLRDCLPRVRGRRAGPRRCRCSMRSCTASPTRVPS